MFVHLVCVVVARFAVLASWGGSVTLAGVQLALHVVVTSLDLIRQAALLAVPWSSSHTAVSLNVLPRSLQETSVTPRSAGVAAGSQIFSDQVKVHGALTLDTDTVSGRLYSSKRP